ncbi:MAG: hypothetical protein IT165_01435 [Bryobacterales bacterium]|nr:hypothetical protein [Bryobacterales bacterium]
MCRLAALSLFATCCTIAAAERDEFDKRLAELRVQLNTARLYVGNYPGGNNDPNPVRRRFLGLNTEDRPDGSPVRARQLDEVLEKAVALLAIRHSGPQRDQLSALLYEATQLSIQGWLICGNISLMEGLRVTYPSTAGQQVRPVHKPVPFGSPENDYNFVATKDASTAKLFYDEGFRILLRSLTRSEPDADGKFIVDIDVSRLPPDVRELPGAFANELFPQYTYYVDFGVPSDASDDRVVAIQTQGYMMGNMLQKQGQALQSIGYRLWTAAYFNRAPQRDPALGARILDDTVEQLHIGANAQFLASIALAASVGDKAVQTAESPYAVDRLYFSRTNIEESRSVIGQIRAKQKPTLPIDEIMAGNDQVREVLQTLQDPNGTPGSISRAEQTYAAARDALFLVQKQQTEVFQEEQTRQLQFLNQLVALTDIPVPAEPSINSASGQLAYRKLVADRITALLNDPEPTLGASNNRLDDAIKQVIFQRQQVLNKKAVLDSYPLRIKIIEDTLGANVSAIREAEGKITAAQLAQGIANSVTITVVAGVTGPTAYAGVNVTNNPGAIQVAKLQNDITRAANLKEMKFLENESAAQIRNLLLDQDLAHGELMSQLILLRNAADDVNKVRGDAERLLGQLRDFNQAVASLWYRDPVWNIELTGKEEEANRALDSVVRNLYKLGKMLEIRWVEPFSNPVSVLSGEPQSLGAEFDSFWSLESVFALGSVNVRDNPDLNPPAKQARSFLQALKNWDAKLRQLRVFEGALLPVQISLRQDIFGLADVRTINGVTRYLDTDASSNPTGYQADRALKQSNIRRFQNLLINNGLYLPNEPNKPRGFLLKFPVRYYSAGFTDFRLGNTRLFGTIPAWNYRLEKFKVAVLSVTGKDAFPQRAAEILFAQSGIVENIDFFERRLSQRSDDQRRLRQINLDNYARYDPNDLGSSGNSPYLLFSIATRYTFPSDGEIGPAARMSLRFWSPFASRWLLQVNPMNLLELENIDDIILEFTLNSGMPDPLPQ